MYFENFPKKYNGLKVSSSQNISYKLANFQKVMLVIVAILLLGRNLPRKANLNCFLILMFN